MNKTLARVIRKIEQDYDIHIFSDKKYIEAIYLLPFGKKLNLKSPKTFNEKIQWLKLYDHNPQYTTMVDKFAAKNYVEKIIGREYIIDTLGKWDSFDQIDFEQLPKQFVLKCTHDSGGLVICRDKEKLDKKKAKGKIEKSLKRNFYYVGREWPYKDVKPQIIAERYMEDEKGELKDYKFYCFNGEPQLLYVSKGLENHNTARRCFLTMDWEKTPFSRYGYSDFDVIPEKPEKFDEMKRLARKLSHGQDFLRVDFYQINGRVYFGELTFYPSSGFVRFYPDEYDEKLGDMLILHKIKNDK